MQPWWANNVIFEAKAHSCYFNFVSLQVISAHSNGNSLSSTPSCKPQPPAPKFRKSMSSRIHEAAKANRPLPQCYTGVRILCKWCQHGAREHRGRPGLQRQQPHLPVHQSWWGNIDGTSWKKLYLFKSFSYLLNQNYFKNIYLSFLFYYLSFSAWVVKKKRDTFLFYFIYKSDRLHWHWSLHSPNSVILYIAALVFMTPPL